MYNIFTYNEYNGVSNHNFLLGTIINAMNLEYNIF